MSTKGIDKTLDSQEVECYHGEWNIGLYIQYLSGVSLSFSAGGNWFSQAGKTFWTELPYKKTFH